MFFVTSNSSLSRSQGVTGDLVRSRNNRLQRKISVIILTDFLCWVPFIIICFLHTIGLIDGSPWYALLSILILPINSVINPVLYDDTMGRVIRRVCLFIQFYTRVVSQTLRTHFRIDLAREPGHTAASIPLDVAGEPGQASLSLVSDIAKKQGQAAATNVAETRV